MIEQFFRPEQLGQALELKARFGNDAVYMGGGSKLNAAPTRTDKKVAISLDKLGLGQIEQQHGQLHIGATVTLQALKDDPRTPAALCEALGFVYSRHLRNQATLGGEIACQQQDSPLLPVLLVLEAVVVLENNQLQPIDAYLVGQRKELVLGVVLPEPELRCATRRISRNADGLAVMTAAVALDALGEMRVALAGVTPQPMRLRDVERHELRDAALEAAVSAMIAPRADLGGSVAYKRYISGVVVADLLVECQQQEVQA